MNSRLQAPMIPAMLSPATMVFSATVADVRDRRERGATMVEYGLLLALVALVAFAAIALFGGSVLGLFTDAENEFSTINGGSNTP